jgi:CheY-like chemotaxis protein
VNLVNESLDYARLEAGRLEIDELDFDLRVTADEIIALVAPLARQKRVGVECRVHHEVPSRLRGDAPRIRQVVLNLAANAIKSIDHGKVAIRVERIDEDDAGVVLRFSVVDTGQAITAERLNDLTRAFLDADASLAQRFGGFGLVISRELVARMGGEVGAEVRSGESNSLWFQLRLLKQPEMKRRAAEPDVELGGVRVLVVDPSVAARHSYLETLLGWGCRAEDAVDGADALSRLRAAAHDDPFKLALVDLHVPGADGEQVGAMIHSDVRLSETRTMLLTGMGRKGDAARARSVGFSAYLNKPVAPAELHDAMLQVMQDAQRGGPHALVTRHSLAEARRGRVRILLVEDNPVNQLVTSWAFTRYGYTLDVARTGAEALEAARRERYDAVVLDVHLTDRDGRDVARELRAREGDGVRVPIVALTMSASPAERESCFAAKMDDVLSKPVDLAVLCGVIERWVRGKSAAPVAGPGEVHAPARERAAPSHALLAEPAAVPAVPAPDAAARVGEIDLSRRPLDLKRLADTSMGIPALRDALLKTFISDLEPRLARLARALTDQDAHRLEFEAHGLKGMAATIGAECCVAPLAELERLGHERTLEGAGPALAQTRAELIRVQRYIENAGEDLLAA